MGSQFKVAPTKCLLHSLLLSQIYNVKAEPDKGAYDDLFTMSIEQLLEIEVVSASHGSQTLKEAPATIRVITAQQIKRRGYLTLDDALKDLPGIDLVNVHGAFPVIHTFRGSYGDENRRLLLLIDGIEENSNNGAFELSGPAYSLHHVERIEVLWGPASALYGANAFSGIINIITKQDDKHQGTEYSYGRGSENSQLDKLYINRQYGDTNLVLSGYRYRTDGPAFTNRHPQFSDAYVDNAYNLSTRINIKGERYSWRLGAHVYQSPMGDGTFGNSPTTYFGLPPASESNPGTSGYLNFDVNGQPASRWEPYSRTAFVQLNYDWLANTQLKAKYIYHQTGLDDSSYSYPQSGENFFKFMGAYESDKHGIELSFNHQFASDNTLHVGVEYLKADIERGFRAIQVDGNITVVDGIPFINWNGVFAERDNVLTNNKSLFAQYAFAVDQQKLTQVTIGGRYDDNTLYGSVFNPRLGLVKQWSPQVTVKALYGRAFRAPTPLELFGKSPVRIENPRLKPETVNTYELGVHYKWQNTLIKSSLFYNHLDNVIVEGMSVGNGLTQIQNAGVASIVGIELEMDWLITDHLSLLANYSYQHASQNNGAGKFDIANIARHKANFGVEWLWGEGWSLHWMNNWIGPRTTVETNSLDKIDSALVSNLTLQSPDLVDGLLNFNLKINNIFDTDYADPGIRSADGDMFSPINEQPRRSILLQVNFMFSL